MNSHQHVPTRILAEEALLRARSIGSVPSITSKVSTPGTSLPTPIGAPIPILPGQTQSYLLSVTARATDGSSASFLDQVLAKNVAGTITIESTGGLTGVIQDPSLAGAAILLTSGTNNVQLNVIGVGGVDIDWTSTVIAWAIAS